MPTSERQVIVQLSMREQKAAADALDLAATAAPKGTRFRAWAAAIAAKVRAAPVLTPAGGKIVRDVWVECDGVMVQGEFRPYARQPPAGKWAEQMNAKAMVGLKVIGEALRKHLAEVE